MKLRYIVESSFTPSFTSSKNVKSIEDADITVERLRNIKAMYENKKYTNFRMYSDDDVLIRDYSLKTDLK